jgi:signal transduction histidine kinase
LRQCLGLLVVAGLATVGAEALLRREHIAGIRSALSLGARISDTAPEQILAAVRRTEHVLAVGLYRTRGHDLEPSQVLGSGESILPEVVHHPGSSPRSSVETAALGHQLVVDIPLETAAGPAVLHVVRSLDDVDAAMARHRWVLGGSLAFAAILATLFSNIRRRRTSGFHRRLAQSLQSLQSGREVARLPTEESDEHSILARHFNLLTKSITEERRAAAQTERRLEERVQDLGSELERSRVELRTLDAAKDAFLANVSHELRTPLTSIVAAAEILRMSEPTDAAEVREFAEMIAGSSRRLSTLVEQIIEAAELEAAPVHLTRARCDLRELASRAREGIRTRCQARSVQILLRDIGKPVPVEVDDVRLLAVLDGLLDNAVKFSPLGATVEVDVQVRGGHAELRVLDEGTGIDESDAERIFQRFGQNRHDLTDKPVGMGLGLPRARRIIDAHGGTLALESHQGFGACFVLQLPLAAAVETFVAKPKSRDSAPAIVIEEPTTDVTIGKLGRVLGG